jgi:hypothetical protein
VLLHIAAVLDWDIQHFDIKTAFLHGVFPDTETVLWSSPLALRKQVKKTGSGAAEKPLRYEIGKPHLECYIPQNHAATGLQSTHQ